VALVTDYDCWHETEEDVTIEAILEVMHRNVGTARRIIQEAVARIPAQRYCPCAEAGKFALLTPWDLVPAETRRALQLFYGKYQKGAAA
jgi:5'-methylthioadenosine phosphorylase